LRPCRHELPSQTRNLSFHPLFDKLPHVWCIQSPLKSTTHNPHSKPARSFLTYAFGHAGNKSFIFCSRAISDANLARCKSKHMGFYSAFVHSQISRCIYSPVHKLISKHIYESPERTRTHASDLSSMTGHNEPRRRYQGISNMPADLACS
jgi:hypothetical protein